MPVSQCPHDFYHISSAGKFSSFLLFTICMLASFLPCLAQDTPTPIPWYFDDGGISRSKNIIKIDPLGIAQGEYGLTWERFYYKILTVEISVGILSKQYKYKFLLDGAISDWYNNFNPEKPGWSLGILNKIYVDGPPDGSYVQFGVKHRHFQEARTNDIIGGIGYQFKIGTRIPIDLNLSIGIRFQKSLDGKTFIYDLNRDEVTIVPFSFKIGYLF